MPSGNEKLQKENIFKRKNTPLISPELLPSTQLKIRVNVNLQHRVWANT